MHALQNSNPCYPDCGGSGFALPMATGSGSASGGAKSPYYGDGKSPSPISEAEKTSPEKLFEVMILQSSLAGVRMSATAILEATARLALSFQALACSSSPEPFRLLGKPMQESSVESPADATQYPAINGGERIGKARLPPPQSQAKGQSINPFRLGRASVGHGFGRRRGRPSGFRE